MPDKISFIPMFGYGEIKKKIKQWANKLRKMKNEKKLEHLDGVIFYGDPGCGKTIAVNNLAKVAWVPLFMITLGELVNENGTVATNGQVIFDIVQSYANSNNTPVIVFFDEFDMILPFRKGNSQLSQEDEILLQQFLTQLTETKGVMVVANTNYFDRIDDAITCHGRLGYHVYFHLPTKNDIISIIKNINGSKKLFLSETNMSTVAENFVGKNVAYIVNFFIDYVDYANNKRVSSDDALLDLYIDEFGV